MKINDIEGNIGINIEYPKGTVTTFVSSATAIGTYGSVMKELRKNNLLMPTTAQTFLLIGYAWKNKENTICADILNKLKNSWLWNCTENEYIPNKGVILYDSPDGEKQLNKRKLVPFGFKIGQQSFSEFEENPYLIAQAGNDSKIVELAVDIAKKFSAEPYIWSFNNVSNKTKRFSALGSRWGGAGLCVGGFLGNDVGGCVFGVLTKKK